MTNAAVSAQVTPEKLDLAAMQDFVSRTAAGAVVTFSGVIRDHDGGREVRGLRYEAHPIAERMLNEVAAEVAKKHPVFAIAVAHRTGTLRIGDTALLCAVSAAHRSEAFHACSELVDALKQRVPIWKHQHFADGTTEWVGL